jgi:hypothetical protein
MDIKIFGVYLNVELLILICVIYLIMVINTLGSCLTCNVKESFMSANTNFGESKLFSISNPSPPINTNNWNQPNMTVSSGQPLSKGVTDILNRPTQPIPLPDGEMLMFANTEFKPECCPNTYSTGSGCACMTKGQLNYLTTRAGNNIPYSEY